MPRLFPMVVPKVNSITITSSQTIVIPNTVSVLTSVIGNGSPGSPGYSGYFDANSTTQAEVYDVAGVSSAGLNVTAGAAYWDWVKSQVDSYVQNINSGSVGTITFLTLRQYTNGYTTTSNGTISFQAIAGSAYSFGSGVSSSGQISTSAFGRWYIAWSVPGAYHPGASASSGSAATGFGCTFPGGYAGNVSSTTFNNVAVVPGKSYDVVVPYGGQIIIQYYT